MDKVDYFLQETQLWIRQKPLLYRFTLGIRSLLAIGFIPTGMVKLLGYRFTTMNLETPIGAFFEAMYQSGPYWRFLGITQVLAGILVLIPATSALGAITFLGILINIFIITISYDFNFTPVITFSMLLASVWLVVWDYNRFRSIIFNSESRYKSFQKASSEVKLPGQTLENWYERSVYITGTLAGLLFFSMLRGLPLPDGSGLVLLSVGALAFIIAIVFALRNIQR
jgi:uncharacterized membrane protein YphA (DoxX/SURF4 family)